MSATQLEQMQTAVDSGVKLGPRFLAGEVDADEMAKSMVAAVEGYVAAAKSDGFELLPDGREYAHLGMALQELIACGGGYLAGRCDADCVARTMTQMTREFPAPLEPVV